MEPLVPKLKRDVRSFSGSRWLNQVQMYPGRYLCTWVLVASVWMLIAMEEYDGPA